MGERPLTGVGNDRLLACMELVSNNDETTQLGGVTGGASCQGRAAIPRADRSALRRPCVRRAAAIRPCLWRDCSRSRRVRVRAASPARAADQIRATELLLAYPRRRARGVHSSRRRRAFSSRRCAESGEAAVRGAQARAPSSALKLALARAAGNAIETAMRKDHRLATTRRTRPRRLEPCRESRCPRRAPR